MPGNRLSHYSVAASVVLCGLLVFLPMALGSAPPWTLWPLWGLACATLALTALGAHRQRQHIGFPFLAWALLLMVLGCVLQLVPLPASWLAQLSPYAAEVREFVRAPLGLSTATPLSIDPPATFRELAKALSYLMVFLAAAQLGRVELYRRRVLSALAATGMAISLIGLGHELFAVESLWGLYRFPHAPWMTPFGNTNHLAGYLILSSCLCLGLAVSATHRRAQGAWALGYLVSGATVFLSTSRAGLAFFLFAQGVMAWGLFSRKSSERPDSSGYSRGPSWWGLPILGVLALGAYLAFDYYSHEAWAHDLAHPDRSKIAMWPMFWKAAWANGATGMGRGAFEVAFTHWQTDFLHVTVTHPENGVLQYLAEWGFPFALTIFSLVAWGLYRWWGTSLRRDRSPLEWAVLAGTVGLLCQNMFDFSLEYPACMVSLLAAWGVVAREHEEAPAFRFHFQQVKWALPIAATLAGLALWAGRSTVGLKEQQLIHAIRDSKPVSELRRQAMEAIASHPANYLFFNLMGKVYSARREPHEALAFANRALFLKPSDGDAHRVAARALLQLGRRSQAFLEYRLAWQSGLRSVLEESRRKAQTPEEMLALVPNQPADLWELLLGLYPKNPDMTRTLLSLVLEEHGNHPNSLRLWQLEVRARVDAKDFDAAEKAVEQAFRLDGADVENYRAQASLLAAKGQRPQAIDLLAQQVATHPSHLELGFLLSQFLLEEKRWGQARQSLERLKPFASVSQERFRILWLIGLSFQYEERHAQALVVFLQAVAVAPENPQAHYQVARLSEKVGQYEQALRHLEEGLRLDLPEARQAHHAWLAQLMELRKSVSDKHERLFESTDDEPPE